MDRARGSRCTVLISGGLASLAVIGLYVRALLLPHIRYDDFQFLTTSVTWRGALANLWVPVNDHAMPLCRLDAAVLMHLVPVQSWIPVAAQLHGQVAVIVGMWLLYAFVRRELGHPLYGLIAMTLWGVTTAYLEAVTWYSASLFVMALDTLLLALLAAQAWRLSGRRRHLVLCAVCCFVAVGWFAAGVLVGPWCALYLLVGPDARARGSTTTSRTSFGDRIAALLASGTPLVGTAAFLAVSLPRTWSLIVHAQHYRGKTVFEAFHPALGFENTIRTLADNQILGAFGIHRAEAFPLPVALAIVVALAAGAVVWLRFAPNRRLVVLGLAVILASDLLTYSARAEWDYAHSVHNWTRYHLFPHLGLVFVVLGGLPRLVGRWVALDAGARLSRRQVVAILALICAAFAVHVPRTRGVAHYFPEQMAVLLRVERTDATCRSERISAATARAALGFLQFPMAYDGDNAWEFLAGSPRPRPWTVEQVRRRLVP